MIEIRWIRCHYLQIDDIFENWNFIKYTFTEDIHEYILESKMNDLMISIMIEINLLLGYLQIDDILRLKFYHTFTEDIYEYILESKINDVMISIR